jgi:hypothetical protein
MKSSLFSSWLFGVLLMACSGTSVVGGTDAAVDTPNDSAPDTPLDAPKDVADVASEGLSLDTPDALDVSTPPDTLVDTPFSGEVADVPPDNTGRCRDNTDCGADEFGRRVCDTASGMCVACTASNRGSCAPTEYCTPANRCETGCGADSDCAITPSTPRCDPMSHRCVACLTDAHCPAAPNAAGRCSETRCSTTCNAGFADCDSNPSNGCEVDTRSAASHCGGCGMQCPSAPNASPTCAMGRCGIVCDMGFADCDGNPSNGCEVDTRSNAAHCGACGTTCPSAPNALPTCAMGTCRLACLPGFADCDGVATNGCEAALSGTTHCGACSNACSGATPLCVEGMRGTYACSSGCAMGQSRCGASCVDTANAPDHCGACGNVCARRPNARPTCAMGTCGIACEADFGDCDGSAANGCEVVTSSDVRHCGRCGNACPSGPRATATCEGGRCGIRCEPGFADCDGNPANGCEVDLTTATAHCGRCGNACPAGPGATAVCSAGRCAIRCESGRGDCDGNPANGCEVDLTTATTHCGRCGNICTAGANALPTCSAGVCGTSCVPGFADCDGLTATGCEASLSGTSNCGRCGNVCGPSMPLCTSMGGTSSCVSGCAMGEVRCGGSCVNTASSVEHCGSCGNACPAVVNATRGCSAGACTFTCATGFGDCDGSAVTGCETDLRSTIAHCGACGARCSAPANATPTCTAGTCGFTCNAGFADCDRNPANGCETDLRTSSAHCGACGNACTTGRCEEGRCISNRSCAEILRTNPASTSGNYTIDPDGAGGRSPYTVYCDMTTSGGGWTVIYQPISPNIDNAALDYTVQDPTLMAASTQVLMAYRNRAQAVYSNWALFELPNAWRLLAPFRYLAQDESVMVVVGGAPPVRATLRYGTATYSSNCSDPWVTTGTWGRICIVGTAAPFYSGHTVPHIDSCTSSNQVWNAAFCTDDLRFTLAVR